MGYIIVQSLKPCAYNYWQWYNYRLYQFSRDRLFLWKVRATIRSIYGDLNMVSHLDIFHKLRRNDMLSCKVPDGVEVTARMGDIASERVIPLATVPLPNNSACVRSAHERLTDRVDAVVDMLIRVALTERHLGVILRIQSHPNHVETVELVKHVKFGDVCAVWVAWDGRGFIGEQCCFSLGDFEHGSF
jgi:hypothetical protein